MLQNDFIDLGKYFDLPDEVDEDQIIDKVDN